MTQDQFERRFADLTGAMEPDEVAELLDACTRVELAAGEVLLTEGTETSALAMVLEGALVVSVGHGADARQVGAVDAGGIVGEVSLLDHGPASATVHSEVGAVVLELGHEALAAFERDQPLAAAAVLRVVGATLAHRLRAVVRGGLGSPGTAAPDLSPADRVELDPRVAAIGTVVTVPADTLAVQAGRRRMTVAVVDEGEIVHEVDGEVVARFGPGSVVGGELLFGGVASTTLRTATDVVLTELDAVGLARVRQEAPDVITALERMAASQLARHLRVANAATPAGAEDDRRVRTDVAVIGGGPIGIAYAWFLSERSPRTAVTVLDRREAPGYKVGESTLATTTRAFQHMGLSGPVMRRLFGVKAGIRFWWTAPGDDRLHDHIDAVDIEETYQVERRVVEAALVASARRRGIDVRMGHRVRIGDSRVGPTSSRLAVTGPDGDLDVDARFVCDASGRAALLPRRMGLHRSAPERLGSFNTNSYYAYFTVRDEPDVPFWNDPATRHVCFEQGWTWFITVLSWEGTPQENLEAMVDHLLDHPPGPDESYPTRRELEERFEATSRLILSVGFTIREDRDTALDESVGGRFTHYRERYPAIDRILDHHDLVEHPYGKRQPYSAFQRLAHDSAAVTGDGWCAVGDAAMFSNPLFSPGLNLGVGTAHEAAADTARALAAGDVSARSFGSYQHYAERTYTSLMGLNDMLYRAFAHRTTYERAMLLFMFHAAGDVLSRDTYDDTDPYVWDLLNPALVRRVDEVRGVLRRAEEEGTAPDDVVRDVLAITEPYIREMGPTVEALGVPISVALREFDGLGQRMEHRNADPGDYAATRCPTCAQWHDASLEKCATCGTPVTSPA